MAPPLSGRDIVIVGQQPWDTRIGSNCKDIAREFSRHNRVLYVNAPLDRNTLLLHRPDEAVQARLRVIRGQAPGLQAGGPNLWVLTPDTVIESINWLPPSGLYTALNRRNNQRFATSIRAGMQALRFQQIVLFNDNDICRSFHLKELLAPELSVYYSRDYMLAVDYWHRHGHYLEPRLIAQSDVCVANSSYLADYCRQYNPLAFDVGQGCEAAGPAPAEKPRDLASIPGPVIGYVGALLSSRLDIGLLGYLADKYPHWSLVLIGPEDDDFRASPLHGLPNVHFLGLKAPAELPAYMSHFDVCLNPQLVNPMTIGNYPRKVDEYLTLGRPVVATRTPAMRLFEAHAYLADTRQDYAALIARALREDNPARQQQRRAFAATHTWQNSVARIYDAIRAGYAGRPAGAVPQPLSVARV